MSCVCVCVCVAVNVGDYCHWEQFTASCDSTAAADEIIVMETARIGRMRLGRCISYDLGKPASF